MLESMNLAASHADQSRGVESTGEVAQASPPPDLLLSGETFKVDRRAALRGVASATLTPKSALLGLLNGAELPLPAKALISDFASTFPASITRLVSLGSDIKGFLHKAAWAYPITYYTMEEIDHDPRYGELLVRNVDSGPDLPTINRLARETLKCFRQMMSLRDEVTADPAFPLVYSRLQTNLQANMAIQREVLIEGGKKALTYLQESEMEIENRAELLKFIGQGLASLEQTPADAFAFASFENRYQWTRYSGFISRVENELQHKAEGTYDLLLRVQRTVLKENEVNILKELGFDPSSLAALYRALPSHNRTLTAFLFEESSSILPGCIRQIELEKKDPDLSKPEGNIFTVAVEEFMPKLLGTLAQGLRRYRFTHALMARMAAARSATSAARVVQRMEKVASAEQVPDTGTSEGDLKGEVSASDVQESLSEIDANESSIPLTKFS